MPNTGDALEMATALAVEKLDTNLYRSSNLWHPPGALGAFGGQTLKAAWHTVPEEFHVHSLHNCFLVSAQANIPVIYQIQRVRDGRSFATRVVTGKQQGKAVLVCACNFTNFNGNDIESVNHQTPMPRNIPPPEELPDSKQRAKQILEDPRIPERHKIDFRTMWDNDLPVDYRHVKMDKHEDFARGYIVPEEHQGQWFRARDNLPENDPILHTCAIVYGSDGGLMLTAVRANGVMDRVSLGMVVSLDHSMWFYAPTRADEWLYYDLHSPRSNNERAIVFGRIYNRQGVLVAATSQEGMIRLSKSEQDRRRQRRNKL